jgi:hypothetical protein
MFQTTNQLSMSIDIGLYYQGLFMANIHMSMNLDMILEAARF